MLVESALSGPTSYHLIVLDYVLPGAGHRASLQLDSRPPGRREHRRGDRLPVEWTARSTACGRKPATYLTKPFQVEQLREIVYRCLESKGLLRHDRGRAEKEALQRGNPRDCRKAHRPDAGEHERPAPAFPLRYLSQIELGKNSASIETLYRICLALGMKMSELFNAIQRS